MALNVFKNGVLQSGTAGANNAVYRFPSVITGIDALVKINGRSSSMVQLVTIDLTLPVSTKHFSHRLLMAATILLLPVILIGGWNFR